MRLPIVLVALVATPFLAGTAQQAAKADAAGQCAVADAHRSTTSTAQNQPRNPLITGRTGCSPVDPPASGGGSDGGGAATGSATIDGTVYNSVDWNPVGSGWTVTVTGPATVSVTTNAQGEYTFVGLPGGTYTVCQVVPSGWVQTYPSSGAGCTTGHGYQFTVPDGGGASFVDFADQPAP